MAHFRSVETLQKFAAVHAAIHNHFNLERHLNRRQIFKQNRSAALANVPPSPRRSLKASVPMLPDFNALLMPYFGTRVR